MRKLYSNSERRISYTLGMPVFTLDKETGSLLMISVNSHSAYHPLILKALRIESLWQQDGKLH